MAEPHQPNDPLEKKSYSKQLFFWGSLLMLAALYSMLDEGVIRRSWKAYQRDFNTQELSLINKEYADTKAKLDAENEAREKKHIGLTVEQLPDDPGELSLRMMGLKLERARIARESKEYEQAAKELAEREITLTDITEEQGFAKADQDEIYYEWKHALHAGHPHGEWEQRYWELQKQIEAFGQEIAAAGQRRDAIKTVVDRYDDEVKKWQQAMDSFYADLVPIQRRIDGIGARTLDIQQVVIHDLGIGGVVEWGKVDRCTTCHAAVDRKGFEDFKTPFKTHPHRDELLKAHPVAEFGCTTCHWGQGRATQIKHGVLEEGDFVHGYDHYWQHPLLRGDFVQSSCFKCHAEQGRLDFAPVATKGKRLFLETGCIGCHNVKGFEDYPQAGPSLKRVGAKVQPEWIIRWIENPLGYDPHTKMPQPPLQDPADAEKIAAYLFQVSKDYPLPYGPYPGNGDAVHGEGLFKSVGCYGCHMMEDKGGDFAPTLDRIMEKTQVDWVYNWIQDPKSYMASRMPSLRLTTQEAADITAYLATKGQAAIRSDSLRARLADPAHQDQGFLLISQYGCYGCHEIQGTERLSKLSVDLTTIGAKTVDQLDFGDTDVPHTWEDWAENKIRDPDIYVHERSSSRMPQFKLSDEEVHALLVFLKGLQGEEPPLRFKMSEKSPLQEEIDQGRHLVRRYNCVGCHTIEGEGGEIASLYEDPGQAPPNLAGQGAKVQPEWLFKFLKDPGRVKIRPWLDIRMPTFKFSDAEAETLIRYFAALDQKRGLFVTLPEATPSPEMLAAGERLVSREFFSCTSCHQQGDQKPAGPPSMWAPDLAMIPTRIRPEFIPPWVQNPQQFTPGVRMPAFLPGPGTGPPQVLEGDVDRQAEAIRDYLLESNR